MNTLDLFCGCGGFAKGFTDAKFNILCGIDKWDRAIESYKQNYNHLALCKDLTKFPPAQLASEHDIECGDIDLIIGGPPCQGFSNAGKRDIKDPRNSLFMEFVRHKGRNDEM